MYIQDVVSWLEWVKQFEAAGGSVKYRNGRVWLDHPDLLPYDTYCVKAAVLYMHMLLASTPTTKEALRAMRAALAA